METGEILTCDDSWSTIVTAGIAAMETEEGMLPDGEQALRFIATTCSPGLVDKFYRVNDRLESDFDAETMQSLRFSLDSGRSDG